MAKDSGRLRFRTTLLLAGKTATGFEVPTDIVERLGAGKRAPVRVTIHGYTYRSTVAVYGGVFMIGVSAEHRAGADVAAGDEIEVELEHDSAPREVTVPRDLGGALESDPVARRNFDRLSYSGKQGVVLPIEAAKTPETRQRRVDKAISLLREGRR
jgi:hypothetical protein